MFDLIFDGQDIFISKRCFMEFIKDVGRISQMLLS